MKSASVLLAILASFTLFYNIVAQNGTLSSINYGSETLKRAAVSAVGMLSNDVAQGFSSIVYNNDIKKIFMMKLNSVEATTAALQVALAAESEAKARDDAAVERYHEDVVLLEKAKKELEVAQKAYDDAVIARNTAQKVYEDAVIVQQTYEKSLEQQKELVTTIHGMMVHLKDVAETNK